MSKRVILVTGTPSVGKTVTARLLASKLDALYVDLTDLALRNNLVLGKDEKRDTVIIDERKMRRRISQIIEKTGKNEIVVDGHYAVNVVPQKLVTLVFVLRRDPVELRKFMEQRGYPEPKLVENLASEILDVCLVDALNAGYEGRTCELNVTGKKTEETVKAMLELMADPSKCGVGVVDWLGKLENEGLLDEYLKI
ncbi:MAG: adenylate kinase family protein [Candidatus Bathyarchaeia archaeon]|jgi:adenylate kinase